MRVALLTGIGPQSAWSCRTGLGQLATDLQGDPVATHALDSGKPAHGNVTKGETTYAEAAAPVLGGRYALLVRATRSSSGASASSSGACCSPPAWRC